MDPAGSLTPPAKVVETHISVLFFFGDRVYKFRKPVTFNFLDFGDRAARRADCEREVLLNRRLAPDVYLGVADLQLGGEPTDHMVVMRRLPEDRRLAALLHQGDLDEWLRRVAETLVAFHARAERSPVISAVATGAALRAGWNANFAETGPFVGSILDDAIEAEIRTLVARWIDGRQPLLSSRIAAGRVCDGHGDLQAADIFCLDDGIRILDCIEFSDELRYGDVIADVAFLAMDLERLGRRDAAGRFLLDYQELSGDRFPGSLVNHYCASRAYVRAKVLCLRSMQGDEDAGGEARRLQSLTLGYLRRARVMLVLVGGLPGSGKSTLAAGLGTARGWTVLRSDEIRRETSDTTKGPVPPYRRGRYSPEATTRVYEELLRRAEPLLVSGQSVVLDASWVDAGFREAARELARGTSSDIVELCCAVAPEEAANRIARRRSEGTDASEATVEVRLAMAGSMDPWDSATIIDTSATPEETVDSALEVLAR